MLGALLGVGASLIGGLASSSATKTASKAAAAAAADNARIQQEQYQQTRTDLQPFTQMGYGAGNLLSNQLGVSPGSSPQSQDYDATNYLRNNPDVANWASADGDPSNDAEQARYHYAQYGQGEDRSFGRTQAARPEAPSAPTADSFFRGFEHSPGYQAQVDAALRAVNVGNSAGKTYFSGGRGIELQGKAADIANQDYGNWWNRQNTLYQSALSQFNNDRQFSNTNYDVDSLRADSRYDSDRAYNTGRQDTGTQNLFNLLGVGANATSALTGAGQNYANNATQNNNQLAANKGNAALTGASTVNNLLGDGLKAYGMFNGQGGNLFGGSGGMRNANDYSGGYYNFQ